MKVDLHCHSKYSDRPSLWFMQKLGCPESFTEPLALYHVQKRMGMDAVTITDHNVIDGCLEILHLPNTFMGCEYTTYFPQDGCKVHVLVYDFTEAQHVELTELRKNIFEFTRYLRQHRLPHSCAHPLFGPNERLTVDHVEQLALLYKHWEINGDQSPVMNAAIEQIVYQMTPLQLEKLENKHGFAAEYPEPWKKILTAGTDCHSALHLGQTYTEATTATTLDAFWRDYGGGRLRYHFAPASPKSFARNVYGIAFQFYQNKLGLDRHVNKDLLLRFLNRCLQARPQQDDSWVERIYFLLAKRRRAKDLGPGRNTLNQIARIEAERLIREDPRLMAIVQEGSGPDANMDELWFDFVNEMANKMMLHFGAQVVDRVMTGRFFDLFSQLGNGAALYMLIAPYLASFSHYQFERQFTQEVLDRFMDGNVPDLLQHPRRVAHFTDTLSEVNGVARTLQQQAAIALELQKEYKVITCGPAPEGATANVVAFPSVGTFQVPEYPELNLLAPPLLEMLDYCYTQGFTHIHIATPGPVGLAALAIARILRLPVSGTYHTAFPEYAKALTDDAYVEDIAWKYMVWFYDQLDAVYVPSLATGRQLIERGIKEEKIRVYPRGIDTDRFHPAKRNGFYDKYALAGDAVKLLYVGRVSKEKNLPVLEAAFRALHARCPEAHLVIVGDGPYRESMQQNLAGLPVTFTGYLEGDALAGVFASSDIFVFPSATDTFGNVVLEAQASGLPVIVTDEGGPQENLLQDTTGFIVPANDSAALAEAMQRLVQDPARRAAMALTARGYMADRGFKEAFARLYAMYTAEHETPAAAKTVAFLQKLAPQQLAS
jgi:glycosyltransferase involved in cell wall biosynthesis